MTGTLLVLVVLYAVWRIATILARRSEREQQGLFDRLIRHPAGRTGVGRCDVCGEYRSPFELETTQRWPRRRVCAAGCSDRDGVARAPTTRQGKLSTAGQPLQSSTYSEASGPKEQGETVG